jgi:hypothetical protein
MNGGLLMEHSSNLFCVFCPTLLQVMISSHGLMTKEEQQRSKRPFSTVISAVEPTSGDGEQGLGQDRKHGGGTEPHASQSQSGRGIKGVQAEQQMSQHPEEHHDRGSGGSSSAGAADGSSEQSSAEASTGWKLEQQAVQADSPARRVGDDVGEKEDDETMFTESSQEQSKKGPSSHSQSTPRFPTPKNDSPEESPEFTRQSSSDKRVDCNSATVGLEGQEEQDRIRQANRDSQRRAHILTHKLKSEATGGASSPEFSPVKSPPMLPYRESKFVPVIPPLRQHGLMHHHHHHHHFSSNVQAVAAGSGGASGLRLPVAPTYEPRAASATAKLQSSAMQRGTAGLPPPHHPRSTSRIPESSRLLSGASHATSSATPAPAPAASNLSEAKPAQSAPAQDSSAVSSTRPPTAPKEQPLSNKK